MVVAAGVDVLELSGLVVVAFGVKSFEEETLDLVGGVQRVAFLGVTIVGELLERAADVAGERLAVAIEDVGEDEDLAGPEYVGRTPIKCAPVEREAQVALALRRKAANRRAVEREVVVRAQQELLVVVEHVQAPFEIAEEHRERFDLGLARQVAQPLFLQGVQRNALLTLSLCMQVQVFELGVREHQKIA